MNPENQYPRISIIIPVYNTEKYLTECLENLITQTYKNIEILCVNDGSTDSSLDILNQFAKKDNRIKVFSQSNAGSGEARNLGLNKANGEYIMFCDADDYYSPQMCEEMLQAIIEKDVDFVICDTNFVYENALLTFSDDNKDNFAGRSSSELQSMKLNIKEKNFLTPWLKSQINVLLWNKIFKAEIIKKYNIRFPKARRAEDKVFIWQYLSVSQTIFGLDKTLYYYRLLSSSLMGEFWVKGDIRQVFAQIQAIKYVLNFIHQYALEKNIPWILFKVENSLPWFMKHISFIQCFEYLKLLNTEVLQNLTLKDIEPYPLLTLCFQKRYYKLLKKIKKVSWNKFCGKIRTDNIKKFYFLGLQILKKEKNEKQKIYYLFGIKIFSKKSKQLNFNQTLIDNLSIQDKELSTLDSDTRRYITCFDCLYDKNQEAIDAYTFFRYLQQQGIPSKYILLKGNALETKLTDEKDIIIVENKYDFLEKVDIIKQSKYILTSFNLDQNLNKILKNLKYLDYIFIEHGVTLLKKELCCKLFSKDCFNKILVPSRLTYEYYKKNKLWDEDQMLCCGLPRWDRLNTQNPAEGIFIFFTWRKTFWGHPELADRYVRSIYSFLERLQETVQDKCKIKIAWHHELVSNKLNLPTLDDKYFQVISTTEVSSAIQNSQMLITDFSSVSWDFLYQNKPVIFYRFDRDELYLNKIDQISCLDAIQEDDNFYNCFYNENEAIEKVKYYIDHQFELEPQNKKITEKLFWAQKDTCKTLYNLLTK